MKLENVGTNNHHVWKTVNHANHVLQLTKTVLQNLEKSVRGVDGVSVLPLVEWALKHKQDVVYLVTVKLNWKKHVTVVGNSHHV